MKLSGFARANFVRSYFIFLAVLATLVSIHGWAECSNGTITGNTLIPQSPEIAAVSKAIQNRFLSSATPLEPGEKDESYLVKLYRFPGTFNPNPIGGRLVHQPLAVSPYPDRVAPGTRVGLEFTESAEYNNSFQSAAWDNPALKVNTNYITANLSHGFEQNGVPLEVGAVVRGFQDNNTNALSKLLKTFHEGIHRGVANIPPPGTPLAGAVGNNHTSVIGKDGQIYMVTVDPYIKGQLLKEIPGTVQPNLAITLSARVPTSTRSFDTTGVGLTAAASKHLTEKVIANMAVSVSHQFLNHDDFNASSNLKVSPIQATGFIGVTHDVGEPGGFYYSVGVKGENAAMRYQDARATDNYSFGAVGLVSYHSADTGCEIFGQFTEGFTRYTPGLGFGNARQSLEPDFMVGTGVNCKFGN